MALKHDDNQYYPTGEGGTGAGILGYYRYIEFDDLINNFMFMKTGEDTLLGKVNRNKVAYALQDAIQQLNYDVVKITKSQSFELNLSTRSISLPQDLVNLVEVSFVDRSGEKHPIMPKRTVSGGQELLQGNDYSFLFNEEGELLQEATTQSLQSFTSPDLAESTLSSDQSYFYGAGFNDYEQPYAGGYFKRFGLQPDRANGNGSYVLDEANGRIYFEQLFDQNTNQIMLDYISDGLEDDSNIQVSKMIEKATYKIAEYELLSNKSGIADYILRRVKTEMSKEWNNAKIRLSDTNYNNLAGVLRNQNTWIKH